MFEGREAAPRMRAAVLEGPGRVAVAEVDVPSIGPAEVLVAVDLCGICGTDLHLTLDGWGRPGSWGGHEWAGRVVAVGEGVTRWQVGDAVLGGPLPACGACDGCRAGRPSLCARRDAPGSGAHRGGFATYTVASEAEVLPLPEGLDPRAAVLVEPLAVALHGITRSGVRPGQTAVVFGAGPIGALTIAALRAMGVDEVGCVEPAPRRQALARAVGAREVRSPDALTIPSIAEPGSVVPGAVDVVLECSGRAAAMEAGLAQLVRGGTLVLVGAGMDAPRFDPNRILLNELVVTGAFNYDEDGFPRALELLVSGLLPVDELVEPGEIGLEGLLDAMHELAAGQRAGKVLVRP